jgi:hypothetical protein
MTDIPKFQSGRGVPSDVEILQLKDFITRGEPATWCVNVYDSNESYTYADYPQAKARYDDIPLEQSVALLLYTRIGTVVTFHCRGAIYE